MVKQKKIVDDSSKYDTILIKACKNNKTTQHRYFCRRALYLFISNDEEEKSSMKNPLTSTNTLRIVVSNH